MTIALHLVYEGKTTVPEGYEDNLFFVGNMKDPVAIMEYKEIPDFLDEEFWSMYYIWNTGRLTGSLPVAPVWGDNPAHLIDGITALQQTFDNIRG